MSKITENPHVLLIPPAKCKQGQNTTQWHDDGV